MGAIAGGVVGGLAALIVILCLILFCLHRRKKASREKQEQPAELPPPVELGTTTPAQEMPTAGSGKYLPLYQQQEHTSPYSGVTTLHSPHSVYAQQSSVSGSPPNLSPYGSPNNASYAEPAYPSNTHTRSTSWENGQYLSTVDSRYSQRGQLSPTSPSHLSYAPPKEAQLYYPPPREPMYQPLSELPASYTDHKAVQYDDSAFQPPPPVSAMPTPTQFYARPAPRSGETEYIQPPLDDGTHGGSVEPQRRPKYGRFVEEDYT